VKSISRALAFLLGAVYALAQIITTIAGTEFIFPAGPIPATSAQSGARSARLKTGARTGLNY